MILLDIFDYVGNNITLREVIATCFIVIGSFISWYGKDWYTKKKSNLFNLKFHPVVQFLYVNLDEITYWTKVPKSREVLQDSNKILFSVFLIETEKLIEILNIRTMCNNELQTELSKFVSRVQREYHNKWQNEGIPKEIVQKLDDNYLSKIQLMNQKISTICSNDKVYISYKVKIIVFLDTLMNTLSESNRECIQMMFMESFNGELKGITYKGVPLNDLEYKEYLINKDKTK